MKIKKMVKALKEIKMLCDGLSTCRTCPFYATTRGCVFLTQNTTESSEVLPQSWNLNNIDLDYEKNNS